jgi:VanZ family protein
LCPRMVVVVLGLTVSLLIEILQHFLPTRDSSMTDVITNTVGTMAGVGFYRPAFILKAWNRLIS